MTTAARVFGQALRGVATRARQISAEPEQIVHVDIPPTDPLVAYFQSNPDAVDIRGLHLDSPTLDQLRAEGVQLVVPLVSQGELIGLLNLGPRLSEQEYSRDDRKLLDELAGHAAPAVRVAQLVRQQEAEVRARERLEQELHVAQLIQQNFLPKRTPQLPGWQIEAYYRPARAVGGDFYDFIQLADDRIGLVIGDVTDKGVPAALVMAATRSVLRAAAQRLASPAEVLQRVNESLVPDIPAHMFVTCLYGVLEPKTGKVRFANAGHNLPYVRRGDGVVELRATGMPLGLMPDMTYEEHEAVLAPGESMLLHSDGLVEAHNSQREMFGFGRLMGLVAKNPGSDLIEVLLGELDRFTGVGWEQEDDVTLVAFERVPAKKTKRITLLDFDLRSEAGNEREAMERVAALARELDLPPARLERLKTAVAETTMNAIEHGNQFRAELPVRIRVLASEDDLAVQITDRGGGRPIPEPETPDLEAKLAGLQRPRGWGLFLVKNMVDDMRVSSDDTHHTVELVVHLKGQGDGQ